MVIVNNTAIINKTTQLTELKRETRSIDGAKPQKVVINEGPGRNTIQKATGREFRVTPIREAVRQTPLPVAMTGRPSEPPMPGGPPSRSSGPPRERGEGRSHGRDRF
jgi:hypothetical protein